LGGYYLGTLLGQKHTNFTGKKPVFEWKIAFHHNLYLKTLFDWYAFDRSDQNTLIGTQTEGFLRYNMRLPIIKKKIMKIMKGPKGVFKDEVISFDCLFRKG
jgi:hypothetical protein